MPITIRMPDLGAAVTEMKIIRWLANAGERVSRGALLAEIETDKALIELESVADGVLLEHLAAPGEMVEAGAVIAYIGEPGEVIPGACAEPEAPAAPAAVEIQPERSAAPPATPVIANLARKLGVELTHLRGSGPSGAITRDDVLKASRGETRRTAPGNVSPPGGLTRNQAAVARAVMKSNAEIPHLRIGVSIDLSAAREFCERQSEADSRVGYEAIFLKAMARAAESVPAVTCHLEGDMVIAAEAIHIGLAVSFENELFMPVLRDVARKTIAELQAEVESACARAQQRASSIEEMTGACMALSNLGMYAIDWFDAIILPGHSVIVALAAAADRAVVVNGRVEIRPLATVNVAADHRLINGRTAAEFATRLKQIVETGAFA